MTTPLTTIGWELAQRGEVSAFRIDRYLLIIAQGDLPTPGYEISIGLSPLKIYPQQFNLLRRERPGVWPAAVTPYRYGEIFIFPVDQPIVTIHHAEGQDRVEIKEPGEDLREFSTAVVGSAELPYPTGAEQAIGFSRNRNFDEAFSRALTNLSPVDPSFSYAMTHIQVLEMGFIVCEAAGIRNQFVRVRRVSMV